MAVAPPKPRKFSKSGKSLEGPHAVIAEELGRLETWAQANRRSARHDSISFWLLKVPATLASAASAGFVYFNLKSVGVVVGIVGAFCVIIDGLNPKGSLRNTHIRAYFEIRVLADHIKSRWDVATLKMDDGVKLQGVAASIVEEVATEKGQNQ